MTDAAAPRYRLGQLIVCVLGPFALGYFLSYLYRAVNAVVADDLVADLGLGPGALGLLTAAYLFGFAGFQLPLGVLLDRFGPRKVQASLLALAAVGAAVFAMAPGALGLSFGRMLIGIGCAGGLMAGFKAVALWVPVPRRALANAVIMAAGGLGILVATVPAEAASQAFGWRGMFLGLAGVTVVVAGLLYALVPQQAATGATAGLKDQLAALVGIYKSPAFWRIAPLVATTCGTHIGIQTLWAGPWLRDIAGLDPDGVARYLGLMAMGFLIGTLTSGAVADWLGRNGIGLLKVMTGFVSFYLVSMAVVAFQLPGAAGATGATGATGAAWFVFGMFGQAGILAYPWMASHFGANLAGRANAAMNFLVFGVAFTCQYTIGAIIGLWPETASGGYAPEAYIVAFAVFLVIQVVALVWYLLKPPRG